MGIAVQPSFIEAAQRLGTSASLAWKFLERFMDDPAHPGLSMERVTGAKVDGLWSARVSEDLRAIVFRDGPEDLLLYVDHHDAAYRWAGRRRVVRHPTTQALQVYVGPQETNAPASDVVVVARTVHRRGLLDDHADAYLLSLGVPEDWLPTVREVVDVDQLLSVVANLPGDVAERLLDLASGTLVTPPAPVPRTLTMDRLADSQDGMVSPDPDDLDRLVDAPTATWIAFLHPSQRRLATADFRGPAKVTGSAGTGKTVVAIHRARHLARQGKRVLLTSYVTTLCDNLERSLRLLCTYEELERIDVRTVLSVAKGLAAQGGHAPTPLGDDELRKLVERFARGVSSPLGRSATLAEWTNVVRAQGIEDWEGYRTASRAGRGTPLTAADRKTVWEVLDQMRRHLSNGGVDDWEGICLTARTALEEGRVDAAWDAVIVDEVQDLGAQALRLVATLGGSGPNGLMVVGDGGQRIFAHRTSLRAAGIEVRGRSTELRVSYRTTTQIRRFADRLLASADDLDGEASRRDRCRSVRSGLEPVARGFATAEDQYEYARDEVRRRLDAGVPPSDIAVIARTVALLQKAGRVLEKAGIAVHELRPSQSRERPEAVQLLNMHRAKGLEFRVCIVVDASKGALPNRFAMNRAGDDQDKAEQMQKERQLLYVSLTRAREEAIVTWVGEPSDLLWEAITAPVPRDEG